MPALPPRRRRHLLIVVSLVVLLVAALALPPLININRYQRQIAASLAASLGRPVEVSGVRLQLLPRPAVQIANFTVDSSPGFSAEPILECSSVTAALRIASLWRGHLEIARISLDEPSLNLERAPSGEWNFASVLLQASRTPQAPTGRRRPGSQRRFPYIEATNARVNFKHGDEKLPFSFLNADVSVWLEQPDEWQLRFAAQPMRTDINLSLADTGIVEVSGSVQRAGSLSELPLNLQAEWRRAPLGQVTRMLMSQDMGWRGDGNLNARITGTPQALALRLTAAASDFHRETFEPAHPMDLQVTCTATYRHMQGEFNGIHCLSPVGNGSVDLSGDWRALHTALSQPDLRLTATQVPASALLDLLRHTRGRLNNDITLSGVVDGVLAYAPAAKPRLAATANGLLTATDLRLRGDGLEQPLPDLRFTVQPAAPFAMVLDPAQLDLGAPQPLLASARLTTQGFTIHYSGSAQMEHLLPLVRAFGLLSPAFSGVGDQGEADYNLSMQGAWLLPLLDGDQPAPPSQVSGNISLRDAVFQPAYLAAPVQIATATATIFPGELRWNGITASLGATRFAGSLLVPLSCRLGCVRHFDLTAPDADYAALAASLRGEDQGVVRELINRVRTRSVDWPALEGSLRVGQLALGQVQIAGALADVAIAHGRVELRSFDGRTLGGVMHASGVATLDAAPAYKGRIEVTHLSTPEVSQLLEERWGPGLLDMTGALSMSGTTAADLSSSARGTLRWTWTNGALPQLTSSPLRRFDRWTGEGRVGKGMLTVTDSQIVSNGATMPVTGTIGVDRSLDLRIGSTETDAAAMQVTGSLFAPVAAVH